MKSFQGIKSFGNHASENCYSECCCFARTATLVLWTRKINWRCRSNLFHFTTHRQQLFPVSQSNVSSKLSLFSLKRHDTTSGITEDPKSWIQHKGCCSLLRKFKHHNNAEEPYFPLLQHKTMSKPPSEESLASGSLRHTE